MNTYRVARRLLSIDPALPEMALRQVDHLESSLLDSTAVESENETVFQGHGQLGAAQRHIDCRWTQRGYSLRVDGVGRFQITGDGRRISRETSSSRSDLLTETVLGPAMTLALALQGVWCLHASAVECGGEVVAFLGPSGAGKSTLGRELPRLADDLDSSPRVRCAADDVLPVSVDPLDEGAVQALPRFPQLKYQLEHQPGDALPDNLPLRKLYVLEPTLPDAELCAERLTGSAAVLALVRHSVAAKLFTKELLRRHMDACVCLAQRVEIYRLDYPHHPASFRRVRELLSSRSS